MSCRRHEWSAHFGPSTSTCDRCWLGGGWRPGDGGLDRPLLQGRVASPAEPRLGLRGCCCSHLKRRRFERSSHDNKAPVQPDRWRSCQEILPLPDPRSCDGPRELDHLETVLQTTGARSVRHLVWDCGCSRASLATAKQSLTVSRRMIANPHQFSKWSSASVRCCYHRCTATRHGLAITPQSRQPAWSTHAEQ